MIDIKVEHCNNVRLAEISLSPDSLNLLYAMNGTGKSTIAKAIRLAVEGGDLGSLRPFGDTGSSTCTITPSVSKVLVFDEAFISNIVFRESEVIQNAFEVFIKSPEYDEKQRKVNEQLKELHIDTAANPEYGQLLQTGQAVLSKFTKTNDGKLKKTGLIKSLVSSESIFRLPEPLKKFQPLMEKEYNVDWVGWKSEGSKFDDNEICPFCTVGLGESYAEEKKVFADSYSKSNVKNIREILGYFEGVRDYIDPDKQAVMTQIIKDGSDEDAVTLWVTRFYLDLEFLVTKVRKVIEFNSYNVKQNEISSLADVLASLIIDPANLQIFSNAKTLGLISDLNSRIGKVVSDAEKLKSEIGTLKGLIGSSVAKAVKDINEFLDMAGIDYSLDIDHHSESDTKAILKYKPTGKDPVSVENIRSHLSWGERNAFALVLFMHFAQSQKPDLVILDDPISSFDTNKKYAIINRLFLNDPKRRSLYQKSTLMLTHDFQPVIDFIVNSKPHGGNTRASFLRNQEGVVSQTEITGGDIHSFALLLSENAKRTDLNGVHRVTSLRKLIEHTPPTRPQEMAYNLLSCLVHGKVTPSFHDGTPMLPSDINEGELFIKQTIGDFSYKTYLATLFTNEKLAALYATESNEYFRLQVFRVLVEVGGVRAKIDDPLLKYIDEQFHVENDYVFYLDLVKYNTVPSFVIPKCTDFLRRMKLI